MVYYMSESGTGIKRYAEMDQGLLDVPQAGYWRHIKYAEPDKVHPSALRDDVSAREQGYRVDPETMPKQYLWANGSEPLPDVLPGFVVSPRFKDLVERYEPGVHQFVPIEIYKKRKGEPVATYYWLIVGQRIDSVDREHTTFHWRAPKNDPADGKWIDEIMDVDTFQFTPIPDAKLVFSNKQVEGHHIWHDPHVLVFNNGLISDEFANAIVANAMTGVGVAPRDSI